MTPEEASRVGRLVVTPAIKVVRYATPFASEGIGIRGQPVPQICFHRPLTQLLQTFFEQGFVLDRFEESGYKPGAEGGGPMSRENFLEIPPVLAVRLCVA